jgi:NodT family efflux transporter outer membrane factor (OMF) lipoprotein
MTSPPTNEFPSSSLGKAVLEPCESAVRWALLVALALSLAGCQSLRTWCHQGFKVGPEYIEPCAPLAPTWIDVRNPVLGDEKAGMHSEELIQTWWRQFNDPVLNGLIEAGGNQNLSLQAAAARIDRSRALRRVAAGNWFPQQQQATGDFSQIQQSSLSVANGAGQAYGQWETGLGLAWEVDLWGRFRRGVEAADAELGASIANYSSVRVLLLAEIAEAYVDLRTASERLRLARQNTRSQLAIYDVIVIRKKAGAALELDQRQAELNLRQTEALIPELQEAERVASNRLCVLLGLAPFDFAGQIGPGQIPFRSEAVVAGVPAELLRRRPDIRQAERLLAAQSARIGIAESELYPHLQLNGNLGWQAGSLGDLFQVSQSFNGLVGPSVRWNLLNYGRITNLTQAEAEKYKQLALEYQQTVLVAQEEVENALIGAATAEQRRKIVELGVLAATESERIVLVQYRAGTADFNRVFAIQSAKFNQQDELARLEGVVARRLIGTYRALGGGWQIDLNPDYSRP